MSYKISFSIVGESGMLMHSDVLADPMNRVSKDFQKITNKGSKSDADNARLAEIQYYASCYTTQLDPDESNEDCQIVFPSNNLVACIASAASAFSLKKSAKRAFFINSESEYLPFTYGTKAENYKSGTAGYRIPVIEDNHPTTPKELMSFPKNQYVDRRCVVIQKNRVPNTRPYFPYWKIDVADIRLDDEVMNPDVFLKILTKAGEFEGIGDYRPRFGRFYVANFNAVEK